MYLDAKNEFSDAQAVTATTISTNVVDLGATNTLKDLGIGEDVYLIVLTQTACTDASSDATLTLTLESDSVANLATSPTVHYTTGALAFAAYSAAGSVVAAIRLPSGNYERYLGVRYTIAAGPLTAGNFDAFLTKDWQKFRAYANGVNFASGA
jgi:hypothetical protein